MSEHDVTVAHPTYTGIQYFLYVFIGLLIWVTGVVLVRLLGPETFTQDSPVLLLLFSASILLGVVLQYLIPSIIRQPMANSLVPVVIMCGTALICDGVAIAFTDVYSSDITVKMIVGGWLLWTIGTQLVISLIVINRANNT